MIEVENLVKCYGELRILNGVSLRVGRSEVAAVIGPSGGGKSTLLRCINGLEEFQEGQVTVDDIRLRHTAQNGRDSEALQRLRRRVGMVFQQFNLFSHLNALENVMCGPLYVLGQTRLSAEETALRLLERVGLKDKVDSRPDQLSGGQQQRVAIARALAMKPEAVLFDEPTSALDPVMAREVLAVIADLAQDGLTMLVVTHSMSFARNVSHTVHVMAEGNVIESGPARMVFENANHPTTREFLKSATGVPAAIVDASPR